MQVHPDTAGDVLSGVMGVYGEGGAAPSARSGAAVALAACAAHIRSQDVSRALDFLLGQALADPVDAVRSQMVDAGAISWSHSSTLFLNDAAVGMHWHSDWKSNLANNVVAIPIMMSIRFYQLKELGLVQSILCTYKYFQL